MPLYFCSGPYLGRVPQSMDAGPDSMSLEYERIRAEATKLEETGDIPQRVVFLHQIFVDSKGNDSFPQVALHGALWAHGYFPSDGTLGKITAARYFYNEAEKKEKFAVLDGFETAFKSANRQVFIDTYTNFYFTRIYGKTTGVERFIRRDLLSALNSVHDAVQRRSLPQSGRTPRSLFMSLYFGNRKSLSPHG